MLCYDWEVRFACTLSLKCSNLCRNILKPHFCIHHSMGIWTTLDSNEPRHDKTNKMAVRRSKSQISLGIRPVWSESSLYAWRYLWSLATHWAHSEDSDQTGRMSRLIWVFAGRTLILLVLACRGSVIFILDHGVFYLTRLCHFSSSVNSLFKRACTAIQWD